MEGWMTGWLDKEILLNLPFFQPYGKFWGSKLIGLKPGQFVG